MLGVVLFFITPRLRSDTSISYKHADYQEMSGRIGVQTQGAFIEQDFGTETRLKLTGVLDSITGATPTGQPAPAGSERVPLSQLRDYRKAWNGELSHQFRRVNVAVGGARSQESDYISTGWSLNALTDFNQKNTTLLTGIAGTQDTIRVFYQPAWAKKRTNDLIVGVTQLLNPLTSVTLNISFGRQRGQLADPYKLVQKRTEIFPGLFLPLTFGETRPMHRQKWLALLVVNRSFPQARGALEASYRYYFDTFSTDAHTIDVSWFQRFGERFVLKPSFRFYDQTAANFYTYSFDQSPIVPRSGLPNPGGPFYSSDYRLSAFRSYTHGLKAIWSITPSIHLDAAWEWYEMHGQDGVTPASAYARARILTAGLKVTW
jgi:hypothetical protein